VEDARTRCAKRAARCVPFGMQHGTLSSPHRRRRGRAPTAAAARAGAKGDGGGRRRRRAATAAGASADGGAVAREVPTTHGLRRDLMSSSMLRHGHRGHLRRALADAIGAAAFSSVPVGPCGSEKDGFFLSAHRFQSGVCHGCVDISENDIRDDQRVCRDVR